jgi:Trk-type K+ transport system membrane component
VGAGKKRETAQMARHNNNNNNHVVVILLWPAYNVKRGIKKRHGCVHTHHKWSCGFFGAILYFYSSNRERERDGRVCMGKKDGGRYDGGTFIITAYSKRLCTQKT